MIRVFPRSVIPGLLAILVLGCDSGPPPPTSPPPPTNTGGAEVQKGKSLKAVPKGVEAYDDLKERRNKNRAKSAPTP